MTQTTKIRIGPGHIHLLVIEAVTIPDYTIDNNACLLTTEIQLPFIILGITTVNAAIYINKAHIWGYRFRKSYTQQTKSVSKVTQNKNLTVSLLR